MKFSSLFIKIRKKIPKHEEIFKNKWFKPLSPYFNKPCYWSFTRKNVALAVAIGFFSGLMPGPTQMITAFILAYLFQSNLAISMVTTFYTNPVTYLPLYYLAFKIGCFTLGIEKNNIKLPITGEFWIREGFDWVIVHGKPLLIGVPILGLILAVISYIIVRLIWDGALIYYKRNKAKK